MDYKYEVSEEERQQDISDLVDYIKKRKQICNAYRAKIAHLSKDCPETLERVIE